MAKRWRKLSTEHPELTKFLMFFVLSNGVTLLQIALMPAFRWGFDTLTGWTAVGFRALPAGSDLDGSTHYIFDYAAGPLPDGGGGLAYFLAIQVTLLIAQVVNFFLQRNITFRSNTSIWMAALWYTLAYAAITLLAAAAQGFYKAPVYEFFIDVVGWGGGGTVVADVITMIINSAISFWVFYPIFKLVFRQRRDSETPDHATSPEVS